MFSPRGLMIRLRLRSVSVALCTVTTDSFDCSLPCLNSGGTVAPDPRSHGINVVDCIDRCWFVPQRRDD